MTEAPAAELRREFNEAGYYGPDGPRADITVTVTGCNPPSPERGLPDGTVSQTAYYSIEGQPVAIVHQDVLPDGTIRGRPDPKCVIVRGDGTIAEHLRN